jgi:hypothetical protein
MIGPSYSEFRLNSSRIPVISRSCLYDSDCAHKRSIVPYSYCSPTPRHVLGSAHICAPPPFQASLKSAAPSSRAMVMCDCGSRKLVCRLHISTKFHMNVCGVVDLGRNGGKANLVGRRSAISQCLWHSTEVEGELLLAHKLEST